MSISSTSTTMPLADIICGRHLPEKNSNRAWWSPLDVTPNRCRSGMQVRTGKSTSDCKTFNPMD